MAADDPIIHFTVDVIDRDDKDRVIQFLPVPGRHIPDPENLIKNWQDYHKLGFAIFYSKKNVPGYKTCPANHCLFGFEDKRFQKYGLLFNELVPKHKNELVQVLRNDQDPQKREAAAYLLAHIKDAKELVHILTPSVYDSNGDVRNSVLRVIGATIEKNKKIEFSLDTILKALDFPTSMDRNKALYILQSLADKPKYVKYIREHALDLLISDLKLLAPNVHGEAYTILKKISGKKFADNDYASWEKWANSQREKHII